MTNKEAKEIIESECYVFNPLNFERSTMVNTALDIAIKALEQEPCEDAISRKAMLDYLKYLHGEMSEEEFIKELPSVTPARKKGKWIYSGSYDEVGMLFCSKCKHEIDVSEGYFKYCPNCGAEMESEV